jgi:UDP-N-acetylmuramoyl-L-alanyl-D-glutamate--2,6-diaminopimelate ligase
VPAGPRPSTPPLPLAEIARIAGATRTGADAADLDPGVTGVTHDSRDVRPGDLYAALPGFRTHGAEFVAQAVAGGAVALLTDPAGEGRATATGLPVLVVADPRSRLGALASAVYADPSHGLVVVGITGTNGKTTTSYLVDAGLRAAGHVTGVIGTVGTRIADDVVATARTTPEAPDVHALLAVMRERGVTAVTMEVSSHALRLGRVDGVRFDVVGFTNLTEDHLDFHEGMDDYFDAKAELFTTSRADRAVVCVDDAWGHLLVERAAAAGLAPTTYAIAATADWTVDGLVAVPGGSVARAHGPAADDLPLEVRLPGEFNLANALGALALLASVGVDPLTATDGIAACEGVPGRMERVADPDLGRGLLALVDYAHTPDAVARVVTAAREGVRGKVIVVLGAGGDRDPHKRPAMGEAAARGADVVVVTDDNPRSEDPADIRAAVLSGATGVSDARVIEVAGRDRAIHVAVHAYAAPGDVLLVLGKGHEQGQEVAGVVTPFDDRVVLAAALEPDDDRADTAAAGTGDRT